MVWIGCVSILAGAWWLARSGRSTVLSLALAAVITSISILSLALAEGKCIV